MKMVRQADTSRETGQFTREYRYSLGTLEEVLRQFRRVITAIESETEALRHLMERSGDRQILTELVETRKIHEFAAEDRIKVEISPDQLQDISAKISIWGLGIAIFFSFLQIALWLLGELANTGSDFHTVKGADFYWAYLRGTAVIAGLFFVIFLLTVKIVSWRNKRRGVDGNKDMCINIFDFANLRYKLKLNEFLVKIKSVQNRMEPLFGRAGECKPCRVYHLLSEMPTSGVEKRKYSFGSSQGRHQENYTLHIEIEIHNGNEVFLTDIRLAVRVRPSERRDIVGAVRLLVIEYFSIIAGKNKSDPELSKLVRNISDLIISIFHRRHYAPERLGR